MPRFTKTFARSLMLLAAALAPGLGAVVAGDGTGEPAGSGEIELHGRVDQARVLPDAEEHGGQVELFVRGDDGIAVRVLAPTSMAAQWIADVGATVSVSGRRGDVTRMVARDGVEHTYATIIASSIEPSAGPVGDVWVAVLLVPLVLAFLLVSALVGRQSRRKGRPGSQRPASLESDLGALEPVHLPDDPAEALAVMAEEVRE